MTPEQQRISIAEACGWKHEPDKYYEDRLAWFDPTTNQRCSTCDLPDYLNDLNAMHEAEKMLKDDCNLNDYQKSRFIKHLENIVSKPLKDGWSWALVHATAAQRAEAFLRTLNLWKDE